jgi:predicted nuclease with TOPRIM domain
VSKDIDEIFNQVIDNFHDDVSQVNALVMEAKDLTSQYENIRKSIVDIYTNPSSDNSKLIELNENFVRLLKNFNSLNEELYQIITKQSNQNTAK